MLSAPEIELLISALYTLEDAHCRLADPAATEGRKEQARARVETARRCLVRRPTVKSRPLFRPNWWALLFGVVAWTIIAPAIYGLSKLLGW